MLNSSTKRNLFVDRNVSKQAVTLVDISPTENISFFNTNYGSRLINAPNLSFSYKGPLMTSIKDISLKTSGTFDVTGRIKWLAEERNVECSPKKGGPSGSSVKKALRDAVICDNSGHIMITIWDRLISSIKDNSVVTITNVGIKDFHGKKLYTTMNSNVTYDVEVQSKFSTNNWDEIVEEYTEQVNQIKRITVQKVNSIVIEQYYVCNNCRRRLNDIPGLPSARCDFAPCKRLMFLDQCSKSFHANIEVEDITKKSFNLTLFKPLIESFLDKSAEDFDTMEDIEIELL